MLKKLISSRGMLNALTHASTTRQLQKNLRCFSLTPINCISCSQNNSSISGNKRFFSIAATNNNSTRAQPQMRFSLHSNNFFFRSFVPMRAMSTESKQQQPEAEDDRMKQIAREEEERLARTEKAIRAAITEENADSAENIAATTPPPTSETTATTDTATTTTTATDTASSTTPTVVAADNFDLGGVVPIDLDKQMVAMPRKLQAEIVFYRLFFDKETELTGLELGIRQAYIAVMSLLDQGRLEDLKPLVTGDLYENIKSTLDAYKAKNYKLILNTEPIREDITSLLVRTPDNFRRYGPFFEAQMEVLILSKDVYAVEDENGKVVKGKKESRLMQRRVKFTKSGAGSPWRVSYIGH